MTDWSFLFVHTSLPGESGDFNLFQQPQVVGVTKEKNLLSIAVESGDLIVLQGVLVLAGIELIFLPVAAVFWI